MLIMYCRRAAIRQLAAEVLLIAVGPLGAVRHRFIFLLLSESLWTEQPFGEPRLLVYCIHLWN